MEGLARLSIRPALRSKTDVLETLVRIMEAEREREGGGTDNEEKERERAREFISCF